MRSGCAVTWLMFANSPFSEMSHRLTKKHYSTCVLCSNLHACLLYKPALVQTVKKLNFNTVYRSGQGTCLKPAARTEKR